MQAIHLPVSAHPLLQDPPFVLALLWLATAIGYRAISFLRISLRAATALERGVLCAAVGIGLLPVVPFCLGAARLLTPSALRIALIVQFVVFSFDMARVGRAGLLAARRSRIRSAPPWALCCIALAGVVLALLLIGALCPPTDTDGLGYHLVAPRWWLSWRTLGYLPTLVHTNSPMGMELLLCYPLALWSDTAAKLLIASVGIVVLLATFAVGRRMHGASLGLMAATAFLVTIQWYYIWFLFQSAYIDFGPALETVCAALALMLWIGSRRPGLLLLAALCAGFAGSFKLTCVFTGALIGAIAAWMSAREGVSPGRCAAVAAKCAAVSAVPVLPWLVRAWLVAGNPVWPMAAGLFPTRDWSPSAARGFSDFFHYYNWGGRFAVRWSTERRQMAVGACAVLFGASAWLFGRIAGTVEGRALAALVGGLAFIALATTGLYDRFFVIFLPLVLLLVFWRLARPIERSVALQAAFVLLTAFGAYRMATAHVPGKSLQWGAATGAVSRSDYLRAVIPIVRIWDYANKNLPSDARIVTPGVSVGYYSDHYCFCSDQFGQQRIRLDSDAAFLASLRRDHIRYLLYTGWVQPFPGSPTLWLRNRIQSIVAQRGRLLVSEGTDRLYELDLSRSADERARPVLHAHVGKRGRR
jgi:hypothetical protein